MADIEELAAAEIRVLGALIEKEMTTPDYYPLSLKSLTAACNQKSNRDPVVAFDEGLVEEVLAGLSRKQLVVKSGGGRVERYAHNLAAVLDLAEAEAAILCLFMLRGPQTAGELNSRSGRLHSFTSLDEVRETLDTLAGMELVKKLPRRPGQKEARYCHLLAGEPEVEAEAEAGPQKPFGLAAEVEELKERLAALEREFAAFKDQFE